MQEGIALLFKRLADIDVFDLEIAATDIEQFVDRCAGWSPPSGAST